MTDQQQDAPVADTETGKGDTPDVAKLREERDKWKALARKHEEQARANADATRRLAELEEQDKTEVQRLTDRLQAAETRAAALESEALRARIGQEAGLPPEFASRLQGSTEEELAADAAELVKHLTPTTGQGTPFTTKPLATLSLGATTPDEQGPVDNEQAFRRLLTNR